MAQVFYFDCDGRRRRMHEPCACARQGISCPRRIQRDFGTKHLRIERSDHSSVPVLEESVLGPTVPLRSMITTALGFSL